MNRIFVLTIISLTLFGCTPKEIQPLLLKQIIVYAEEEQSEINPDTITLEYNAEHQLIRYEAVGYEYYLLLDSLQYDNQGRVISFRESDDSENPYGGSLSIKRITYKQNKALLLSSLNYNDQDKRYLEGKIKIDTVIFKLNGDNQPVKRVEYITRRKARTEQTTEYAYANGDYADADKMIIPHYLNPYRLVGDNLFWAVLMNDIGMGNLLFWENSQCTEIDVETAPNLAPDQNNLQYPASITLKNCNNSYYKTVFIYSI